MTRRKAHDQGSFQLGDTLDKPPKGKTEKVYYFFFLPKLKPSTVDFFGTQNTLNKLLEFCSLLFARLK